MTTDVVNMGTWCNGNTTDFDSVVGGSNPPVPVGDNAFGRCETVRPPLKDVNRENTRGLLDSAVGSLPLDKSYITPQLWHWGVAPRIETVSAKLNESRWHTASSQ